MLVYYTITGTRDKKVRAELRQALSAYHTRYSNLRGMYQATSKYSPEDQQVEREDPLQDPKLFFAILADSNDPLRAVLRKRRLLWTSTDRESWEDDLDLIIAAAFGAAYLKEKQ